LAQYPLCGCSGFLPLICSLQKCVLVSGLRAQIWARSTLKWSSPIVVEMRVRHLQSHLAEQGLIHQGKLQTLQGLRIGVDVIHWLRSIHALKDPFADALGGVPPGIFGFVDRELELFRKVNIFPIFVFQGMAPTPQHSMFVTRMDQQMEMAWSHLANGLKSEAQKCFAVSTSRINSDFLNFIFHHLRHKGFEVLQAPYFAGAQLAHFMQSGAVHTILGPPGLLLYQVQRVVIHVDFGAGQFEWVDLDCVLQKWQINKDQFVDACMLAGTEYCLTYPYLNPGQLSAYMPNQNARFNFDQAVQIAKSAPIINWMQTFPTEEMKHDHVDGYCLCKVLVQSSPVLHIQEHAVKPLGATMPGWQNTQIPYDFHTIMGEKLPNSIYYLMANGVLSHKMPQALARGEWVDKSAPLVDTVQFHDLWTDLLEYREKALASLARHLHVSFSKKIITCKAYWDTPVGQPRGQMSQAQPPSEPKTIQARKPKRGLRWRISAEAVQAEMHRQSVQKVDLRFCLRWHANEFEMEGQLYKDLVKYGDPSFTNDRESLAALVNFMLLEQLELIADDGAVTVLGNVLMDAPQHLQEPLLVALEMMKFGVLNGEPFESAQPERPFPEKVNYPKAPIHPETKATLLLCRVMSLVPMKLRADMWNAVVDFDLAAFHSLVRILKRSLRQLTEASLASVLLKDLPRVKLLPEGFMCPTPIRENHMMTQALLPTFMLPRACMGIVCQFMLKHQWTDPGQFARELTKQFPCCLQPLEDLKMAFHFWEDVRRCVNKIAEPLGAEDLAEDMSMATRILESKKSLLGI